eukprot:TRINITY_DN4015_c1_g1_i1.p1 TRINITY_DN4015_c1_g1~~TRINITY_DN4015_c1_g1_i1.p1  ORF type:complete len:736 (-),score=189.64 TRINITY_DN4015_c1_g1_i1:216-2423(-)
MENLQDIMNNIQELTIFDSNDNGITFLETDNEETTETSFKENILEQNETLLEPIIVKNSNNTNISNNSNSSSNDSTDSNNNQENIENSTNKKRNIPPNQTNRPLTLKQVAQFQITSTEALPFLNNVFSKKTNFTKMRQSETNYENNGNGVKVKRTKSQRFMKGELVVKDKKTLQVLKEFVPNLLQYEEDKTEDLESELEMQDDMDKSLDINKYFEKIEKIDSDSSKLDGKGNSSGILINHNKNKNPYNDDQSEITMEKTDISLDIKSDESNIATNGMNEKSLDLSSLTSLSESSDLKMDQKYVSKALRRRSDIMVLSDLDKNPMLISSNTGTNLNSSRKHSYSVSDIPKGGKFGSKRIKDKSHKKRISFLNPKKSKSANIVNVRKDKKNEIEKTLQFWLEGKSSGVFGVKLDVLIETDNCNPPLFLLRIINHLNDQLLNNSLNLNGLFDAKLNSTEVLSHKSKIDNRNFAFDTIENRTLIGLLKLFFCELPEPLFGIDQQKGLSIAEEIKDPAIFECIIISLLYSIPENHKKIIQFLLSFFSDLVDIYPDHSEEILVCISKTFGPILLGSNIHSNTNKEKLHGEVVLSFLITKYEYIFENTNPSVRYINQKGTIVIESANIEHLLVHLLNKEYLKRDKDFVDIILITHSYWCTQTELLEHLNTVFEKYSSISILNEICQTMVDILLLWHKEHLDINTVDEDFIKKWKSLVNKISNTKSEDYKKLKALKFENQKKR